MSLVTYAYVFGSGGAVLLGQFTLSEGLVPTQRKTIGYAGL